RKTVFPPTGVYIDDVFTPSPAAGAGVRPGDFLVALGGHQLFSVGDFQTWLYVLGIGTQAELDLLRDGKPMRVVAPIEARPDAGTMRQARSGHQEKTNGCSPERARARWQTPTAAAPPPNSPSSTSARRSPPSSRRRCGGSSPQSLAALRWPAAAPSTAPPRRPA